MDSLTHSELDNLLKHQRFPCASLAMPLDANNSGPSLIRWKNLLGRSEESLAQVMPRGVEVREFLEPARTLLDQPMFWRNGNGLAAFIAPGLFRTFAFSVPLPETVVVGKQFHIKTLLPFIAGAERFFVLTLSENGVHLLEGSRQGLKEMTLRNVPDDLDEVLSFSDKQEPLQFHGRRASGGGWGAIFSGQGVGIDDRKDDILRFFQMVNHGVHEHLQNEHAPLVLAGVHFLWPLYHQANTYRHVVSKGIAGNPARLSAKELHDRAWEVVLPLFQAPQRKAANIYAQLAGTGRTASELAEVVKAAFEGKLETLFIARDVERWGTFDPKSKTVTFHQRQQLLDEDLLNVAAVHTFAHGGSVYVMNLTELPTQNEVAGLYWLPMPKHQGKRRRKAHPLPEGETQHGAQ
jgi:hypothetical protein